MSILALTSDTLIGTPAAGNLEYNGQFFGTDSAGSRAQLQRIVRATAVSASSTSVDFTGIPAWVERITVMLSGISTNGTSLVRVQIGDSGGIENTGYVGSSSSISSGVGTNSFTAGFDMNGSLAADIRSGHIVLTNISSNIWVASGMIKTSTTQTVILAGDKTLSDVLTQVRLTTVNGTDTFDAGTVNIIYEG
jgi:hypothetical protein